MIIYDYNSQGFVCALEYDFQEESVRQIAAITFYVEHHFINCFENLTYSGNAYKLEMHDFFLPQTCQKKSFWKVTKKLVALQKKHQQFLCF